MALVLVEVYKKTLFTVGAAVSGIDVLMEIILDLGNSFGGSWVNRSSLGLELRLCDGFDV